MATLTASKARTNLYRLIDDTSASHKPVVIIGKRNSAILVAEDDWIAIRETLNLRGMCESIRQGLKEPLKKCANRPGW